MNDIKIGDFVTVLLNDGIISSPKFVSNIITYDGIEYIVTPEGGTNFLHRCTKIEPTKLQMIQKEIYKLDNLIAQKQNLISKYNEQWYKEIIEPHKHLLGADGEINQEWMKAVGYNNYVYFISFANIKG